VFSGEQMLTLEQIEAMVNNEAGLGGCLIPMQEALIEYPSLRLTEQQTTDLIHGKTMAYDSKPETYCLNDHSNRFLGIGIIDDNGILKVKKLFLKSYQS